MLSATTVERIAYTAATLQTLPDDLLEDIFLRLDEAADLARASMCCTSFRGIISGRRFLRRYQSLHRPPVLGFLDCTRVFPEDTEDPGLDDAASRDRICAFYQAESSPAASQISRDADFTFAFLPDLWSWRVVDFRDGRVLLSGHASDNNCRSIFEDLVIYDPLHRRHVQLPAIPRETKRHRGGVTNVEAFLVPITDKEKEKDEEHLPFRVICNVYSKEKIWAYIFSSVTGTWRASSMAFVIGEYFWLRYHPTSRKRHYACGCFFWTAHGPTRMLALEMMSDSDMKFSIVELPYEFYCLHKYFAVVEAAKGRLGLSLLLDWRKMLYFYSKSIQDGVAAGEWRLDITASNPLPSSYHVLSVSAGGAAEGFILIWARLLLDKSSERKPDKHYFTLDVKTLLLERLCVVKDKTWAHFPYASFPPSLSLPSI